MLRDGINKTIECRVQNQTKMSFHVIFSLRKQLKIVLQKQDNYDHLILTFSICSTADDISQFSF